VNRDRIPDFGPFDRNGPRYFMAATNLRSDHWTPASRGGSRDDSSSVLNRAEHLVTRIEYAIRVNVNEKLGACWGLLSSGHRLSFLGSGY
jgi:hypothetical protein